MHIEVPKNTGFCVVFQSGFVIATEVNKGTKSCMLQKPPKNRLCLRPPVVTLSVLHLPCPG